MNENYRVAIVSSGGSEAYPTSPPFPPDRIYPELEGRVTVGKERNIVYDLLRSLMLKMGLDASRHSRPDWNPLGQIIRPGNKVLIKPNLVRHVHLGGGNYNAVVTHGSLVRAVLDYAARALEGRGELTVGDAPVQGTDFLKVVERTGLRQVCDEVTKIWGIPVRLIDFRLWSIKTDELHMIVDAGPLTGDTEGYCRVDLGERSFLASLADQSERFRVTCYAPEKMSNHHTGIRNEYLIPKTVMDADVVISLPKLKTHRKVGLTASLKNMVGINGYKDWLPHHRAGSLAEGGDEYLQPSQIKKVQTYLEEGISRAPLSDWNVFRRIGIRITSRLIRALKADPYLEGSWYGNDTLWRTVLDLNRLVVYADKNGIMSDKPQRTLLYIIDGIIGGEGEGPMEPDARDCGMLIGGGNPVAVDAVAATIVGFDYRKIPLIAKGFTLRKNWPLVDFNEDDVHISTDDVRWTQMKIGSICNHFGFRPPSGWVRHIELGIP